MFCARVDLEPIVADGSELNRSKKQKATANDGLITCYI
jgi:hypothetical protein